MPRYESSTAGPEVKEKVKEIVGNKGGLSLLSKRLSIAPTTIKRVLNDQPISTKNIKKLTRGLGAMSTGEADGALEPSDVIERYDAVSTAAADFVKHFANGTERLLGTGHAREAYQRLQDALKQVA